MKVSDIMTKKVFSVKKETPLSEAAGLLAKLRIHGMPVVDEGDKVIGIITESDFFTKDSSNIYLPTFLDFIKDDRSAEAGTRPESVENKSVVSDIMTTQCVTVSPDLHLENLISMFKDKNFNSFPVINDSGALQGIVTIMDVIKLL